MRYLMRTLILLAGLGLMAPASAQQPGMGTAMMHGERGMAPGKDGMRHGSHGWKATLSDTQRKQLAALKLDYKKKVYPLKARLRQVKVDLALLLGTDKPSQKSIDQKINAISKLKAEQMRLKAAHRIAVRKMLNEAQRVQFDMKLLKKAYHGKRRCQHGGHH